MIAIINYGVGNVGSIFNMLNHIGVKSIVTKDPSEIKSASKLILPGVGAFDPGMTLLNNSGVRELLEERVTNEKTPVLGICLGMQMMSKGSEEGQLSGLGWIDAACQKFKLDTAHQSLRIPHMGWNDVFSKYDENSLFPKIDEELQFYFAHSYHLVCDDSLVMATTIYGYEFPVAVKKDNIFGVQFHPEKSHKFGMNFLKAFAELA